MIKAAIVKEVACKHGHANRDTPLLLLWKAALVFVHGGREKLLQLRWWHQPPGGAAPGPDVLSERDAGPHLQGALGWNLVQISAGEHHRSVCTNNSRISDSEAVLLLKKYCISYVLVKTHRMQPNNTKHPDNVFFSFSFLFCQIKKWDFEEII